MEKATCKEHFFDEAKDAGTAAEVTGRNVALSGQVPANWKQQRCDEGRNSLQKRHGCSMTRNLASLISGKSCPVVRRRRDVAVFLSLEFEDAFSFFIVRGKRRANNDVSLIHVARER